MTNILKLIARSMPRHWVRQLGALQFKIPALRPLINYLGYQATKGVSPIASGPAKGLLLCNEGGFPGYSLGTTEPEEQVALVRETEQGMCVYNVGANIGFHALLLCRCVGPDGIVICFEPFEKTAELCQTNLSRNGFEDRSMVVRKAVADSNGETDFVLEGGSATFRIFDKLKERSNAIVTTVDVCTLDEFFAVANCNPPDIITLDIEGAEIAALRGAEALLTKYRPILL